MSRRHTHKNQTRTYAGTGRAQDLWRRISEPKRVGVLLSTMVILLGFLYSLTFSLASTETGSTVLSIIVTSGGFPIHFVAIPEKRSPSTDNNGTLLTVEVRTPGETTPLSSSTITTSSGGTYSGLTINLNPGTYDVTAKGYSHLRVKKSSVALSSGATVNFTNGSANPLLSGDVNGANGDNTVNGIDLSLIVTGLTTYNLRYDMNRDTTVNGIDLTNTVSNLQQTGAS